MKPVFTDRKPALRKKWIRYLSKRLSALALIAGLSILMAAGLRDRYRVLENESFTAGERIDYRIHYGFINAAEARVEIAKQKSLVNNRVCFKVNVTGKTVGAFDFISKVRDTWRSYVDTSAIVTQMFYRNIQENNFRKEETVYFNHADNSATSKIKDVSKTFKVPDHVQDIISSYYYLRTFDFERTATGEIFEIPVFFDDQLYRLRVKYAGRDQIRTKFGRIKVFKLNPLLPDNKLFKGENSIRIWVSDDENKIPVKAEADLWIGALAIDIKGYKNLRTEPKWAD